METVPAPRKIWLNALLFGLTLASTFGVGLFWGVNYVFAAAETETVGLSAFLDPEVVALGILYAAVLMVILLGHELGHYLTCRRYGIHATLPFFIPAPSLTGTFGAVIKIRSPIAWKSQLFDIGAAGPVTGFLLTLPAVFGGMALSRVVPGPGDGSLELGESLLFKLAGLLFFRHVPAGAGLALHPAAFAGWVGLLVTALNLFPLGQLDGGHIAYAMAGRKARLLSKTLLALFVVMGVFFWAGWLVWAVLAAFLGLRHPQVMDEDAPLSRGRKIVFALVVLIFVLSFVPDPVKGYGLIDLLF